MWQSEFPLPCDGPAPRSDLTAIDHVAQTMQYEEFLSWLLYYTALFDMDKTPQLEIADPMGIVYSQAVESPGRGVRFTLNGSMAANALSSRFIHHYFGAGVQHIAFATADVFAAAEQAQVGGQVDDHAAPARGGGLAPQYGPGPSHPRRYAPAPPGPRRPRAPRPGYGRSPGPRPAFPDRPRTAAPCGSAG